MMRQELSDLIKKSIEELQKKGTFQVFEIPEIKIERPENESHGDYATGSAFSLSKLTGKPPAEVVKDLYLQMLDFKPEAVEKMEPLPSGFYNFFLSDKYFQNQLRGILENKEKYHMGEICKKKKIQVEFISANPTGPLTVGNARGGPFGDVLANILEKAGAKVERAYYVNDFGAQILTLGHSVLKDSDAAYKGDYIEYLNKKIKGNDAFEVGQKAATIIINEMVKKTVERMGIEYDEWFSERTLHRSGAVDKALDFLKGKKLLYENEGAVWFKSTDFGDIRDRVVVTQDKRKTYLAGDIAYHRYKFEEKKFDKVINIWGADHHGDVPGLQAGVAALGHKGKLDIILLQFVTLFEQGEKVKMSKREGKYVTMDELLKEVGSDVIRFFFLQKSADTHLNFDLSLAKEQSEKNPVFYVQYAYARISSILRKSKGRAPAFAKTSSFAKASEDRSAGKQKSKPNFGLLKEEAELELIKQLIRLPEIIEDTAKDYQVQRIPSYALELAAAFHHFYTKCRVIDEKDQGLSKARLALVLAAKIVLKNTLSLLGISAPEKM